MNAEFQRIARRDKKAFMYSRQRQRKTTEWEKTRDLFEKIRDTKGIFQAKIGTIKNRNGMHLTEAKNIKKRQKEYTEELHKKDLQGPDKNN